MPQSRLLLSSAIALSTLVPAVAQADVPRVGVVVATRMNLTDGEGDQLAAQLGDSLRADLQVDVIAGADARRRLPTGGLPEDCIARKRCVRDVAERLDADQVLFLVMVRIGPRLQIDSTWVDAKGGGAASRPALVIEEGGASADVVFADAATRLLPNAAPRAEPTAVVGAEVTPVLEVRSEPRGRHVTTPMIVAGAVAGAALVAGIAFAISANGDYAEMEEQGCDRMLCSDAEDRVDRMENKALAADILFGAAAAAALTGGIMYLVSAEDAEAPPVRIGATGDSATVSFGGRF